MTLSIHSMNNWKQDAAICHKEVQAYVTIHTMRRRSDLTPRDQELLQLARDFLHSRGKATY